MKINKLEMFRYEYYEKKESPKEAECAWRKIKDSVMPQTNQTDATDNSSMFCGEK